MYVCVLISINIINSADININTSCMVFVQFCLYIYLAVTNLDLM